jgi:hypothetical protein
MELFDQPDLQTSCPRREASTHSPQALEMLNGTLSNQLAEALAERLRRECPDSPNDQLQHAFLLTVGRCPTPAEQRLALEFLGEHPLRELALALFNTNAFFYVD